MGLKREFTEFESACFNGDLNKVQRLVDKNNINEGLSCACEGNWMNVIKNLISKDCEINWESCLYGACNS